MAKNLKTIGCLACGSDMMVDAGASTGVCGTCMTKIAGNAAIKTVTATVKTPKMTKAGVPRKRRGEGQPYKPSGFPRGWHFKLYYKHTDGRQFSKGKELTDKKAIAKAMELQKNRDKAKVGA